MSAVPKKQCPKCGDMVPCNPQYWIDMCGPCHERMRQPQVAVRFEPFDAPGGDVYCVGEYRIDVPYADWLKWDAFRRAPWWKRLFLALFVSR